MAEYFSIPFLGWVKLEGGVMTTFTTEDRIEAMKFLEGIDEFLKNKESNEVEVPVINQGEENDEQQ